MHPTDRPGSAVAILIVGCVLWHMFAVAAYLLPQDSDGFLGSVRQVSVPYILSLSQWQKWDIFSPNPLRRVSSYVVERDAGDRFETALTMDFNHLSWYERAKELKILGRLQEGWKPLLTDYLTTLCPRIPDAQGTDIRLQVESSIVSDDLFTLERTAENPVLPSETLLATVRCPRS